VNLPGTHKKMIRFFFRARRAHRALPALLAKSLRRAIPPASAAIPARASSDRIVVADATVAVTAADAAAIVVVIAELAIIAVAVQADASSAVVLVAGIIATTASSARDHRAARN
jgi:hypothetical protein